jgi:hypothetical protein
MYYSKKSGTAIIILVIVLLSLTIADCRAQDNWIYVYYVQTDKSTYEVGEDVSITASYDIHYLNSETLAEGCALSCSRADLTVAVQQWLNEPNGTHIRRLSCTLDPIVWNPGKSGEIGTADCSLFLDTYQSADSLDREVNFTVVRANQNCSLIGVIPTQPLGNTSSILLSFRIYNRNNPSFGVGLNSVNYSIRNPEGLVVSNTTKTNSTGYCSISFSPMFSFGEYRVSLRSLQNASYKEERFDYTLVVDRSPVPTTLNVTWEYVGAMFNSSSSYTLEPLKITAKLACLSNGTGIGEQELSLVIRDVSNSTVSQINGMTNESGFLSRTLLIPCEGEFTLDALYNGLCTCWCPSSNKSPVYISARVRPLSVTVLGGMPSVICLGVTYAARFLILDRLSGKPVPNTIFVARTNGYCLANATTNEGGVLDLSIQIPFARLDLLGNSTLIFESASTYLRKVYDRDSLSTPLLCKIPTTTVLNIASQTVFEEGETISISTEILSFDSTPIAHENLTLKIFGDKETDPIEVMLAETNDKGICTILAKASRPGNLTIIAVFNGSRILNSSSDVHSITVLPRFQERLPSYYLFAALACLLAVTTILVARKVKRRLKWHNLMVSRSLEET